MAFAGWITKAIFIHSWYLIRTAVPRQQRLKERAPVCHVLRWLPVFYSSTLLCASFPLCSLVVHVDNRSNHEPLTAHDQTFSRCLLVHMLSLSTSDNVGIPALSCALTMSLTV